MQIGHYGDEVQVCQKGSVSVRDSIGSATLHNWEADTTTSKMAQ